MTVTPSLSNSNMAHARDSYLVWVRVLVGFRDVRDCRLYNVHDDGLSSAAAVAAVAGTRPDGTTVPARIGKRS